MRVLYCKGGGGGTFGTGMALCSTPVLHQWSLGVVVGPILRRQRSAPRVPLHYKRGPLLPQHPRPSHC